MNVRERVEAELGRPLTDGEAENVESLWAACVDWHMADHLDGFVLDVVDALEQVVVDPNGDVAYTGVEPL